MPATAGRVKMPANNRMQTSASLNTHSIWQNAIGYDPYAAEQKAAETGVSLDAASSAQDNMKALLALAKDNRVAMDDEKGGWRGNSKLRGASKDFGEVAPDRSAAAAADDDMPSSTSSFDSEDEDAEARSVGGPSSVPALTESKKRSREEAPKDDKRERKRDKEKHKHRKEKKEKKHKHKHHKSEKHAHHKSDKKNHKRRHESD
eukprot:CAMPEP_0115859656 /NCGR_PEP_ID=MMETSP0287-20121206/16728_1 /TAXON_ID=412157 /ORGANISM="Chrysochromulina rotalis, Strain UIO044" /LENGTH=203 /DNA_ID=CAMNT_0003313963 /DNA_START=65 /DNA_END=676 /DNA_ORIENTATION=-